MNDPINDRLRADLSAVDAASLPDEDTVRARVVRARRRIETRRRVFVGTAAAVVVLGASVAVWQGSDGTAHITGADVAPSVTEPVVTEPVTTASAVTVPGGGAQFVALPPGPLGAVVDTNVVWTGSEAWAVGATPQGATAPATAAGIAAYDPVTQQWRVVEREVPVGGDPLVIMAGTSVVLIGRSGHHVTVYDTTSDDRSDVEFPASPVAAIDRYVPAVWDGHELLVWPTAADAASGVVATAPVAFDPVTFQWRSLAAPPLVPRSRAASVWTGSEWIVWGGTQMGTMDFADGAAYNPVTDTWRPLAASPLSARRAPAVWTGHELLVAAGASGGDATGNFEMALSDGAAYDPASDTWRPIAAGLAHPGFAPVWTGTQLLMFAKGGVVWYDPATDEWISGDAVSGDVPHDDRSPVWTGSVVLLLGSYDGTSGGAMFIPAPG